MLETYRKNEKERRAKIVNIREKIAHAYLAASLIRLRRNKYTGDSGTKGNSTMYNKGNASIMIENNRYESTAPSI